MVKFLIFARKSGIQASFLLSVFLPFFSFQMTDRSFGIEMSDTGQLVESSCPLELEGEEVLFEEEAPQMFVSCAGFLQ